MANENNAGGQTPTASDTTPGQTPTTVKQTLEQPQLASDDEDLSTPISREEARRLRQELKQRRETEKAALVERDKLKESLLSESERRDKRLAELQAKEAQWQEERQQLLISHAVALSAAQVGIIPELAVKLVDWSEVETDDQGQPTNIADLLKKLLKRYPQLSAQYVPPEAATPQAQPAPRVPPTNPARSQVTQGPQETIRDLTRYTLNDVYKRKQ